MDFPTSHAKLSNTNEAISSSIFRNVTIALLTSYPSQIKVKGLLEGFLNDLILVKWLQDICSMSQERILEQTFVP